MLNAFPRVFKTRNGMLLCPIRNPSSLQSEGTVAASLAVVFGKKVLTYLLEGSSIFANFDQVPQELLSIAAGAQN